jgi:hypothetical protein
MLLPNAANAASSSGGQMLASANPNQRIILIQGRGGQGTMQSAQGQGVQPQQLYVLKQPGSQHQQVFSFFSKQLSDNNGRKSGKANLRGCWKGFGENSEKDGHFNEHNEIRLLI